jgi:hypothetical protein
MLGKRKRNAVADSPLSTDWNSVKAHQDFNNTPAYPAFKERFQTFSGGPPRIIHVDFKPEGALDKAITAPVTEVATFVFGPDGVPSGFGAGVEKFGAAIEAGSIPGFLIATYGFALEEVEIDGKKGKAAVLAIGWDSVDAHMQFRETQTFKDNIHFLRDGVAAAEMHHVQFLEFLPAQ